MTNARTMIWIFALSLFLTLGLIQKVDAQVKMSDGQIAEVMDEANEAEIDAGKLASSRAQHPQVKEFASAMVTDHKANKKQGKAVIKAAKIKDRDSEMSKMVDQQGEDKVAELKKLKGAEFDKAYIDSQVAMHKQLIDDLDSKFIPNAQNAEFKSFLTETRDHVQKHLNRAEQIQTALNKAAPTAM